MEIFEVKTTINNNLKKLLELGTSLDIELLKNKINILENKQNDTNFWSDNKVATRIIKENNAYKKLVGEYEELFKQLNDLKSSVEDLHKNYDKEMYELILEEFLVTNKRFEDYEILVLLKEDYDRSNAILSIHPGAGGTESQDWANMLLRMYQRYAAKNGYSFEILDYEEGLEAGIKSCSILIKGEMAYGYLKAESGVHRLVRISPFDSSNRRHTSFASVEVTPEFNNEIDIKIDEKDLEISTMRSSGAGGQNVNKVDSAVRMKHIPSGIVVTSQSERSQLINKENCLNILKSKLYQIEITKQKEELNALKGEQKLIEWGSQIRSYVFCPYTLAKDHRSNYEEVNVEKVMDGEIEGFIFSYLKNQL